MERSFSIQILEAFGAASAALARARERLALFPEPGILLAHVRLAEQEALAWLEGESFFPDQLAVDYGYSPRAWRHWPFTFVRTFDRALPAAVMPNAAVVSRWLSPDDPDDPVFVNWRAQPLEASPERLGAWERRAASATALPPLLAAADLAASFARAAPLPHGNIVIGAMLAERYALQDERMSAGGLIAIGLKSTQVPWRALVRGHSHEELDEVSDEVRDTRCRLSWLNGVVTGCDTVVRLDQRLRLWLARLDEMCARRRKSSHLREVALLAGAGPSLTVTRAAQSLKLSRQATTRLVKEACDAQLLREITYGNAFRRYVIAI